MMTDEQLAGIKECATYIGDNYVELDAPEVLALIARLEAAENLIEALFDSTITTAQADPAWVAWRKAKGVES